METASLQNIEEYVTTTIADLSEKARRLFLGFTHVNSKTRAGKYSVGHLISKKKKKQFKANLKQWLKGHRNTKFSVFMAALNRKLRGTNNYYSVSGAIMVL